MDKDLPFLEPEIFWAGESGDGKTISEFPIIYYTMGNIWSVTGRQFWMYRLLDFFIFFLGLWYLRKICIAFLGAGFWSNVIPLFFFTSGLLAFYSNNFLMNVNAMSLALVGSFHFVKFYQDKERKRLWFAAGIFTFAALLKVTSLLLFFGAGAILLFEILRTKSLINRWKDLLPLALLFVPVIAWHAYVHHYNSQHTAMVFLQGILPIWELNDFDIGNNWELLTTTLLPTYFNRWVLVFLLLSFPVLMLVRKKKEPVLVAMSALVILGTTAYILLFYQVFNHHDYYLINLLPLVALLCLSFIYFTKENFAKIYYHWATKTIALVGVCLMCWSTATNNVMKFDVGSDFVKNSPFIEEEDLKLWQWFHWDYERGLKHLENIDPYLDSLGIERNEKVFSSPDASINISLYLLNRPGYSEYGFAEYQNEDKVEYLISKGVRYMIINKPETRDQEYLKPYMEDSIGARGNTVIYRLSSKR